LERLGVPDRVWKFYNALRAMEYQEKINLKGRYESSNRFNSRYEMDLYNKPE